MKMVFNFLIRSVFLAAFIALAVFFFLAFYYRSSFPVNTWINGIYCTGKTVAQVNEELVQNDALRHDKETSQVMVLGENGVSQIIEVDDADIYPDYTDALRTYLKQSAGGFWVDHLQIASSTSLVPEKYVWNEGKLQEEFDSLSVVKEELAKRDGVFLGYDDEAGYYLEDGNRGRLDIQKAYSYLKTCLSQGETVINLVSGGCYYDREDTLQDRGQRELWEKINAFSDCKIVYDMGAEKIPLTADITSRFLKRIEAGGSSSQGDGSNLENSGDIAALDENGNLLVSEEKVRSWVKQLAEAYDTCNTEREFLSTRGDVVTVKYGTYGTKIDVEAETAYLLKAVQEERAETENHIPAYTQKGYVRGLDDIGDTYIEVDMTAQRMYFYFEGELVIDTDVVTGDVLRHRETPEGIYYVYFKQRNRILRGGDYPCFVNYWMAVVGGVGIHDASWRNSFGGEIYKRNGSHGCINTPLEKVSQLYDMAEKGVPVIMFY